MRKFDLWANLILAILVAVLTTICVVSILREIPSNTNQTATDYVGK